MSAIYEVGRIVLSVYPLEDIMGMLAEGKERGGVGRDEENFTKNERTKKPQIT
jgi:hypothetical protein